MLVSQQNEMTVMFKLASSRLSVENRSSRITNKHVWWWWSVCFLYYRRYWIYPKIIMRFDLS